MVRTKRVTVRFYRSATGQEPVRDWLRELPKVDRAIVGDDLKTIEFGWPLGMPLCRSLGDGLWEVRSHISDGRIARVLFCLFEDNMFLLTAFIKKTQKTPQDELRRARQRMKDVQQ